MSVAAAANVDGILAQLRQLLGSAGPVPWPPKAFGSPVPAVQSWSGDASTAAHATSEALEARRRTLAEAYKAVGPLVDQASHVSSTARAQMDGIVAQWQADKSSLSSVANTPAGKAALLHLGALRIQEARGVIADAQGQFTQLAGQVHEITGRLRKSGGQGTITAAGWDHQVPKRPQLPLPETPWEYNIDLTSQEDAGKDGLPMVGAGTVSSIDDVWKELNRCFNCNFPMGGAPKELPKVGDELPLEIRAAGQKLLNFPVKVTQIERTANDINIEFATLPGHVDGEGATIHFHFFQSAGQLHLGIRGYIPNGPGTEDIPILSPTMRTGYTGVAYTVWQPYINNLTRHIAQSKGYFVTGPGG